MTARTGSCLIAREDLRPKSAYIVLRLKSAYLDLHREALLVEPCGTSGSLGTARGGYVWGMSLFVSDDIVESAPEGCEPLHDREYRVRAYRTSSDDLLLRGAVRDQKPPGLYAADDPDPLTVHHMQVDLYVAFPSLEVTAVDVGFETHPETGCPAIVDHYEHLVGLSIARGFTGKVRELFGGPRGCTHVTALLNAMAPVAVQCFWSMQASTLRRGESDGEPAEVDPTVRDAAWQRNVNSCHIWREDSEVVVSLQNGEPKEPPLFVQDRLRSLGRDPSTWTMNPGG